MPEDKWCSLSRQDFEYALEEMGSVTDVSVNDLIQITDKARRHAQLRRAESLLARDIMSQPVHTVLPDIPLSKAAQLMLASRVSGLPVVDSANRLVGIITEADFLCAIGLPCHQPAHNIWKTFEAMFANPLELREPNETVEALMIRNVITVGPEQTLHEALEAMKAHLVKRLVVVNSEMSPIGMITRSDLVRVFFRRLRQGEEPEKK